MKDDKLEKEFNSYFEGAEMPEGVTDEAKKLVGAKRSFSMPKFAKYAGVAASVVLAVGLCVWGAASVGGLKTDGSNKPSFAAPSIPDYGDAPSEAPPSVGYSPDYDDEALEYINYDYPVTEVIYGAEAQIRLIDAFAAYRNAEIENCALGYVGGEPYLIKAQISLPEETAEFYAELTDSFYEPLSDYRDGEIRNYSGHVYCLTEEISETDDFIYKIFTEVGGTKYYLCIQTSEKYAYIKYLETILS